MNKVFAIVSGLTVAATLAFAGEPTEKKAFSDLDKNKDGVITQSEASVDRELVAHFNDADADRNGFLTPSEFDSIVNELEEAE